MARHIIHRNTFGHPVFIVSDNLKKELQNITPVINYHVHTDTSGSCYKKCGGTVASYGCDSFGTMVCKCSVCGYNYTYSRDVPGVEQIGANGNNNYPNAALGGCIQRILICTKNSTYIDSFTVGDMTFYP